MKGKKPNNNNNKEIHKVIIWSVIQDIEKSKRDKIDDEWKVEKVKIAKTFRYPMLIIIWTFLPVFITLVIFDVDWKIIVSYTGVVGGVTAYIMGVFKN